MHLRADCRRHTTNSAVTVTVNTYPVVSVAWVPLSTTLLTTHAASKATETLAVFGRRAADRRSAVDELRSNVATRRTRCVLAVALTRLFPLAVISVHYNPTTQLFSSALVTRGPILKVPQILKVFLKSRSLEFLRTEKYS